MLPQKQNLEVSQPGDSGHVIPGTVSGDVCHHIDSRNVTPGAGQEGVTLKTVNV